MWGGGDRYLPPGGRICDPSGCSNVGQEKNRKCTAKTCQSRAEGFKIFKSVRTVTFILFPNGEHDPPRRREIDVQPGRNGSSQAECAAVLGLRSTTLSVQSEVEMKKNSGKTCCCLLLFPTDERVCSGGYITVQ